MVRIEDLTLSPEEALGDERFMDSLYRKLNLTPAEWDVVPLQRSIDARNRNVVVRVKVEVSSRNTVRKDIFSLNYPDVSNAREVIVVGAGPAGLFAALR